MIAKNSHLNIPKKLYTASHSRTNESISWLFIQIRYQNDIIKLPKLYIYQITNQLNARSVTLNQLHIAAQEDDEPILLKHTITNKWP